MITFHTVFCMRILYMLYMHMYLLPAGCRHSVWLGMRCVWLGHGGCSRAGREAVSLSSAQRRWPWCCPGDQSRGQCQPALSGENQLVASHPTGMCTIYNVHDEYIMLNVLLHIYVHIQCVSVLITILEHHICNIMTLYMYMYMYVYPLLHACISLHNAKSIYSW